MSTPWICWRINSSRLSQTTVDGFGAQTVCSGRRCLLAAGRATRRIVSPTRRIHRLNLISPLFDYTSGAGGGGGPAESLAPPPASRAQQSARHRPVDGVRKRL